MRVCLVCGFVDEVIIERDCPHCKSKNNSLCGSNGYCQCRCGLHKENGDY